MKNYPQAKKSLGQNFLVCDWALSAIIEAADLSPDDTILEVGPGTGVLTKALAPRVKKVIAVEKDERLAAKLRRELQSHNIYNVEIHEGDILEKIPPLPEGYKIVANIPYYLAARFLRLVLEQRRAKPIHMVLMVQKEVAERLIAAPPRENLLAISVQAFGMPSLVTSVPASCFTPKPKVDSAVIAISHISGDFFARHKMSTESFFRIVRAGFGQKRKMLVNSLLPFADKQTLADMFIRIGIGHKTRPEEMTLNQWAVLVDALMH